MSIPNGFYISQHGNKIPFVSGLLATYGYCEYVGVDNNLINNHFERAKNLLIDQFRKRQSLPKLIKPMADEMQEAEYAISQLGTSRSIDVSTLERLDFIGSIVGIDRNGKNDTEYRKNIYTQIFINSSSGEPEAIINACKFFSNATKIKYSELYPAKVLLEITTPFVPTQDLLDRLQLIAVGAVKIFISFQNNEDSFELIDEGFSPTINTYGFGEYGEPNEGGKLIEKL
jgi:hypothetical protein